jgi:class 3 adenylate cyclase
VTVLFADVVGSMDIAAAVGAERLREIMGELVGRGAAVVRRFGGTMDKFTGDGVMAVFGGPATLEDHTIRACLAALAMQNETHLLADELRRRDAIELQLRVGLNSGQVVVGEIGSGVAGYTAIGEQVGLAQRGGVMLTESTAHLVENTAVLTEAEPVRIKGHDEPVSALFRTGQLGWCVPGTAVIVETLLERDADGDIEEAQTAIERLENTPAYEGSALWDIWLVRRRALLSSARRDGVAYQDMARRYRTLAESLGFEGHIAMAEAM